MKKEDFNMEMLKIVSKIIAMFVALVMGVLYIILADKEKDKLDTKKYLGDLLKGHFWLLVALLYCLSD